MDEPTFDIRIRHRRRTLVDLAGFYIPPGSITFLFGESGIGKTLSAKALLGLLDPEELDITINGSRYGAYLHSGLPRRLRRDGFFVFQEPSTHLHPLLTLEQQLVEGSPGPAGDLKGVMARLWRDDRPERIRELLDVYPTPHRPSGGEKQRILCALALMKMDLASEGPENALFVFDEPTGSLDNRHRDLVLEMIVDRFRRGGSTVLLITHDYSMISQVTTRHRDLLPRMVFRELVLTADGLRLTEFLPETYLSWKSSMRPATALPAAEGRAPALTIDGRLDVFGRPHIITRLPGDRSPIQLIANASSLAYLKAPSGTGKTTVAKMVMGLLRGSRFRASIGTQAVHERTPQAVWERSLWGKKISMVFQHADEALNPRATVRQVFAGLPLAGRSAQARIETGIRELFEQEAGPAFYRQRVESLSGGQKQRLNLLRSFLLDTDILILDEPLNGLDFRSIKKVIAHLQRHMERGNAMLVISHNEEIFDAVTPREGLYYLGPEGESPRSGS
jgi:peptide/nickel transport system ATP-binding protein